MAYGLTPGVFSGVLASMNADEALPKIYGAIAKQMGVVPKASWETTDAFAAYVSGAVSHEVFLAIEAMRRGRAVTGIGSNTRYSITAKVDCDFSPWAGKFAMMCTAVVAAPRALPFSLTANSKVTINVPPEQAEVCVPVLGSLYQGLAAQLALYLLLPPNAQKIIDTAGAVMNMGDVRGYRTQVTVNDMNWFEPAEVFPSDDLLGRILALA